VCWNVWPIQYIGAERKTTGARKAATDNLDDARKRLNQAQIILEAARTAHAMGVAEREAEAHALAERLRNEQIARDAEAAQLQEVEARALAERLMEEQIARDAEAVQLREAEARALAERLRNEQIAQDAEAAKLLEAEAEARALAEGFRNEEITRDAEVAAPQEMDEEVAQGSESDVAPGARSVKKRLRISDSDGEDDTKPASDDEGDAKELTEADLRRREGEQYS